jgi:hypothetical protein
MCFRILTDMCFEFAAIVAATSLEDLNRPGVVGDTEITSGAPAETEAPPVITERDLGIGRFSTEKGKGGSQEAGLSKAVVNSEGKLEGAQEREELEGGALGSSGNSAERESKGRTVRGGQSTIQETQLPPVETDGDTARGEHDQTPDWSEREEAEGDPCSGRRESVAGQCEWEGGALRFPELGGEGWALLCTLVPESELYNIPELTFANDSAEQSSSVISDGSQTLREPSQELQIPETVPSARPPRVTPIGLDEYRKAALQQKGENNQNASEAAQGGATVSQKRAHPDGPRFNYASVTAGAKVVGANKEAKGPGNVLDEDKDKYLRNPCSVEDQWIVIELTQDTRIDTVVVSNFEFYSSGPKNLSLFGSQSYPNNDVWTPLGEFTAQNVRTPQSFELSDSAQTVWVRYLMIKLLSHYGSEFYCTLSLVRVHGTDALESFREELVEAMRETGGGEQGGYVTEDGRHVALAHSGDLLVEVMGEVRENIVSERGKPGIGTAAVRGGALETEGADELLQTPAELDGSQLDEGKEEGSQRGGKAEQEGIGGNAVGHILFNNARDETKSVSGQFDGNRVLASNGGEVHRGSDTLVDFSAGNDDSRNSSGKVTSAETPAGQPNADRDASSAASATEDSKAADSRRDDLAGSERRDATAASASPGQQPDVAAPALTTGPLTSGRASATAHPAAAVARGAAAGVNGRSGGDFVLKVLLQKLKGLEVNASLFEGYISETHQQFSHSLNGLDAEIEALALRLNTTVGMVASMWARLQAVVSALATRYPQGGRDFSAAFNRPFEWLCRGCCPARETVRLIKHNCFEPMRGRRPCLREKFTAAFQREINSSLSSVSPLP